MYKKQGTYIAMAIYIKRLFFTKYELSIILWPRGTYNTALLIENEPKYGEFCLRVLNLELIFSRNIFD